MKAVTPHADGLEPPRDRHNLGHAGHVMMKRRVEARNLGQVGISVSERLDQLDLTRQMFRVPRADPAQFHDQIGRDPFGLMVAAAAMDDTVPNGGDLGQANSAFEPIDQEASGRLLIWGIDLAILCAAADGLRPSGNR